MPELLLEHLVGDVGDFFRSYRDQAPLLVRGALEDPAEIFGLRDLDALLSSEALRPPYVGVSRDGRAVPESEYTRARRINGRPVPDVVDSSSLLAEYEAGATITWYSLQQFVPKLRPTCASLSAALGGSSDAFVFLTPGGTRGFRIHIDPTEVFAVQLQGTKAWRVWPPLRPRPLEGRELPGQALGPPLLEAELASGDVLYVPWGAPHAASAGDATSVHLSLTVTPQLWRDLILGAVARTLEGRPDADELPSVGTAALADELRQRLRLLSEGLEHLDAPTLLSELIAEARNDGELDYFGSQASRTEPVDADSALVRRTRLSLEAADSEGRVSFEVDGRVYSLPSTARAALELVAESERLRAGELAVGLNESQALKLARRLLGIGVLRVER